MIFPLLFPSSAAPYLLVPLCLLFVLGFNMKFLLLLIFLFSSNSVFASTSVPPVYLVTVGSYIDFQGYTFHVDSYRSFYSMVGVVGYPKIINDSTSLYTFVSNASYNGFVTDSDTGVILFQQVNSPIITGSLGYPLSVTPVFYYYNISSITYTGKDSVLSYNNWLALLPSYLQGSSGISDVDLSSCFSFLLGAGCSSVFAFASSRQLLFMGVPF